MSLTRTRTLRRVAVTGLGAVTPLGTGLNRSWKELIDGRSGVVRCSEDILKHKLPSQVHAPVLVGSGSRQFDAERLLSRAERHSNSLFTQMALVAAEETLSNAKWSKENFSDEERENVGVSIGSGIGGFSDTCETLTAFNTGGYRKVLPHFIPKMLANSAGGAVSIKHGLRGPSLSCSTACATGGHSIGEAFHLIQNGHVDAMICGGTEAAATMPLAIAGFSRCRALSTAFNDSPEKASRPFDQKRDGFVIGDGCGLMFLEEMERAVARNAPILAEVVGYGLSADANHITNPDPHGDGAARAMKMAMKSVKELLGTADKDADSLLGNVGYINAHATSTPLGDRVENHAIKRVFGDHSKKLRISSTKGALGHSLGGAGGVEAVLTVKALVERIAPPTINIDSLEPEFDLNYVPNEAQVIGYSEPFEIALSNSFGFGGVNSTLAFASPGFVQEYLRRKRP